MFVKGDILFVSLLTKRACICHGTEASASRVSFRCLVKLAVTSDHFGSKPLGTQTIQEPMSRLFVWSRTTLLRVVSGSGNTPTGMHGSSHPTCMVRVILVRGIVKWLQPF